jgi:ABC-type nickel/cobalt efflux system permease component RcnA
MRRLAPLVFVIEALAVPAWSHDIPNARVDRAIQAILGAGRLEVDYEVSLSELTLTQDLRALIGTLPGVDRRAWFDRYGQETGPLNAKGLLVAIEGRAVELRCRGFDLSVEEHPRYTFHFEAAIPRRGRLAIQDTNFEASEGTSRLAVRGAGVVRIRGDDLPSDLALIPARPVWQLTDAEERRTKQVEVTYETASSPAAAAERTAAAPPRPRAPAPSRPRRDNPLSRLLDGASGLPLMGLGLIAVVLGAAHAIQPGHGKMLVTATALGERGSWLRGAVLAAALTLTHTGSVVLIAVALGWTRSERYPDVHTSLARVAGFVIAAIGLWRLGRHLAGLGEHDIPEADAVARGGRGLIGLGVAGGLVPCWDAVGLIVLAEAVGRLALGLALLLAFSLGMAAVLIAVGAMAAGLRRLVVDRQRGGVWARRLGIAGSAIVTLIGLSLLEIAS